MRYHLTSRSLISQYLDKSMIEDSSISFEGVFLERFIFDPDRFPKMSIPMTINLDDTVDLSIEPFDMDDIATLGMCQSDNTPFASILGELPDILTVRIPQRDQSLDHTFHRSDHSPTDLRESFSPEIVEWSDCLEYMRMEDIIPWWMFMGLEAVSDREEVFPVLDSK